MDLDNPFKLALTKGGSIIIVKGKVDLATSMPFWSTNTIKEANEIIESLGGNKLGRDAELDDVFNLSLQCKNLCQRGA